MVIQQQAMENEWYQDLSMVCEASEPIAKDSKGVSRAASPRSKEPAFPEKLHYVLKEMEKDGLDHIMAWQPHGRAFIVHDPKEFTEKILPFWFRQSKFPSFQRQLNLYGFRRLTRGPDAGGYYHERFLRGKEFLALGIVRTKIKGNASRRSRNTDYEPPLHMFPPMVEGKPGNGTKTAAASNSATNTVDAASTAPQQSPTPAPATAFNAPVPVQSHSVPNFPIIESQVPGIPKQSLSLLSLGSGFHSGGATSSSATSNADWPQFVLRQPSIDPHVQQLIHQNYLARAQAAATVAAGPASNPPAFETANLLNRLQGSPMLHISAVPAAATTTVAPQATSAAADLAAPERLRRMIQDVLAATNNNSNSTAMPSRSRLLSSNLSSLPAAAHLTAAAPVRSPTGIIRSKD